MAIGNKTCSKCFLAKVITYNYSYIPTQIKFSNNKKNISYSMMIISRKKSLT